MPPPGIEPATPCFPACPSNHSAIGAVVISYDYDNKFCSDDNEHGDYDNGFGDDNELEHHGNYDYHDNSNDED